MILKQKSGSAAPPENLRGRGSSIAVLDTGISPVADFIEPKNRILAFLDLVNGKSAPYDDNGHGTQLTEPKHPPFGGIKKDIPEEMPFQKIVFD